MTQPLTDTQRREVFDALLDSVRKHLVDYREREEEWLRTVQADSPQILTEADREKFEVGIEALLKKLGVSHVGFYNADLKRCSAKMALCADYSEMPDADGIRWVFQDVHDGGPAAKAGIRPGDALLTVDGRSFRPPEHPFFALGSVASVEVIGMGNERYTRSVSIPEVKAKRNQLPKVEPVPIVSAKNLEDGTGYLHIASYPGAIGVEIARDVSNAIASIGPSQRLIVDLRGNTGGGIGVLRLMSLLTPGRVAVGSYSDGRMRTDGQASEDAFVFAAIPKSKAGLLPLATRFLFYKSFRGLLHKRTSVSVLTEGLGRQPFHGRVVLLVNRHTTSANEMLLAFARQHQLAAIVGEPTPGRVLAGQKFRLPHGYWVALPTGSYEAKDGNSIEGRPITPDVEVLFNVASARAGQDVQLDRANEVVREL